MKSIISLLAALIFANSLFAQRTINMRNLWAKPEVHVLFQGYTLSFTIKDIDKALSLLVGTGDTTFGTSSRLVPGQKYSVELFPGSKTQYRNALQYLLQNQVATFLLTAAKAEVRNPRNKKVPEIIMDIQPTTDGVNEMYILFYDPRNNKLLYSGKMSPDMYKKDLGLD